MVGKGSQKLETIVGNETRITGKDDEKGTIRIEEIEEGGIEGGVERIRG